MRIRVGDRVRLKGEGDWGTVVNCREWGHIFRRRTGLMCSIRMDEGGYCDRTKRQLEKPPRYRGIPEARDMATAMKHLQEHMR
jgi:hypothetical protein